MNKVELIYQRTQSIGLMAEKMADGSAVVMELNTKTVHSLNPTAAAAFAAIENPAAFSAIAASMTEILNRAVDEEQALAALAELEDAGLAESNSTREARQSRRQMMRAVASVAGIAAPMVLTLTASEQRAYAQSAGSGVSNASLLSAAPSLNGCSGGGTITITGKGTHFTNSSVVTFSQAGITVISVIATSATSLQVSVTYSTALGGANANIKVTTGSEVANGTSLLVISNCAA